MKISTRYLCKPLLGSQNIVAPQPESWTSGASSLLAAGCRRRGRLSSSSDDILDHEWFPPPGPRALSPLIPGLNTRRRAPTFPRSLPPLVSQPHTIPASFPDTGVKHWTVKIAPLLLDCSALTQTHPYKYLPSARRVHWRACFCTKPKGLLLRRPEVPQY